MSEQLDRLIAAVEAGLPSPTNWRNFAALPVGDGDNPSPMLAHRAYHGSLDAAKALHDALLPGWHFHLASEANGRGYVANVSDPEWCNAISSSAGTPARAWLLAILRAYRSLHE